MSDLGVVVQHHETEHGEWGGAEARPHPWLAPYLLGYESYWEAAPGPQRRRHLPSGAVTLIVGAEPLRIVDGPGAGRPGPGLRSFVAGLHDGPALSEHGGRQAGFEVKLTPLGARRLLGVPMHELAGQVVPLDDLLGPLAGELTERLLGGRDWPAQVAAADELLGRRLAVGPRPDDRVVEAWRRLAATGGALTVGGLAEHLGWSRRHLAQRFRHEVGVTPKAAARLLRFERAVGLLERAGGAAPAPGGRPARPSLAGLAAACGYYDQAHFNREFRALAGSTPVEHLRALLPSGATAG